MKRVTIYDYPYLAGKKVKLDESSMFYDQSRGSVYGIVERVSNDPAENGPVGCRWIRVTWYGKNSKGIPKEMGTNSYPSFELYFYEEGETHVNNVFDF